MAAVAMHHFSGPSAPFVRSNGTVSGGVFTQFIKSVYVYRDYTLEIEFNVSFEEFRTMATECQDQGTSEQPLVYITA